MGVLLMALGAAWFLFGYSWIYSLALLLLALGAIAITSAMRRKNYLEPFFGSKHFSIPLCSHDCRRQAVMSEETIGRGTWYDMMAKKVIDREQRLGRNMIEFALRWVLAPQGFRTSAA